MKQKIQNMISDLREQVEKNVPDFGEFDVVHETIENTNPNMHLSHIRLLVRPPYGSINKKMGKRYAEINVFNTPDNPYVCERLICNGNKQEILDYLEDSSLAQKILDLLPQLESDLNNI